MIDNSANYNNQYKIKCTSNECAKEIKSDQPFLNFPPINIQDYTILNKISDSNMTEIFQVKSNKTGKLYAAKVFQSSANKDISKIFTRQVTILSQLTHLSIIKFIGYSPIDFENKNNPTLITEMLGSGSLYDIIELEKKENGSENWNSTMKLVNIYALASAMSHMHSRNILHRNLRTRNIFINEFLCPKIGSFLFAKFLNEKDDENEDLILGQAAFVAPEIWRDSEYSKASDVYAFAMIVYQIMTNQEPFEDLKYIQIMLKSQKERPKFETPIPEAYQKLIESCWDDDPNKRPTFDQIVIELKNNKEFITKDIDENFYRSFIDLIEDQQKGNDITSKQNQIFSKIINDSIYERLNAYVEGKKKANEEEIAKIIRSLKIEQIDINDFVKLENISSGGFGSVFKIQNKATQKVYAAKKLNKEKSQSVDFLKEMAILSDIKHPFIMKLIGYSLVDFDEDPSFIIISEYVRNGSLEQILTSERERTAPEFWNNTMKLINIYGIACAISYLHSFNILHSDIKPANVLVDDYLFPKICDFGLSSKMTSKQNSIKISACTYNFAAPEIFMNSNYSKKSDVYAFGMLLYEMISNKYPFRGYRNEQIVYQVLGSNERPKLNESTPDAYKKMIESCWDADPDKRPTFDEIIDDLKTKKEFTSILKTNADKQLYHEFITLIENQKKGVDVTMKQDALFKKYNLEPFYKKQNDSNSTYATTSDFSFENLTKKNTIHADENSIIQEFEDQSTGKLFLVTKSRKNIVDLDQDSIANITKEAEELTKLTHPAIQRFYNFSFFNDINQLEQTKVNEYLNHKTLFDVIINKRSYDWTPTKKLINIYGIASAMSHLHSHHILHPYLNPKNILVDKELHPILTEVGDLTGIKKPKIFSPITTNPFEFNFLFYLSPEMFSSDENVAGKSDVYSFGLIVYQIITGNVSFYERDRLNSIQKIMEKGNSFSFDERILRSYTRMIERCLSLKPKRRPSFTEILNDLENRSEFLDCNIEREEYEEYIQYIKDNKQE